MRATNGEEANDDAVGRRLEGRAGEQEAPSARQREESWNVGRKCRRD